MPIVKPENMDFSNKNILNAIKKKTGKDPRNFYELQELIKMFENNELQEC